jgi:aminoglycoside phosphotransferase (APT) family kinase protein
MSHTELSKRSARLVKPISPQGERTGLAELLLSYLRERLGVRGLDYAAHPEGVSGGWETYTYQFQLRGDGLPEAFAGPLILRRFAGPGGRRHVSHEFTAQRRAADLGYPVASPLLLETGCDLFGGPFFVMEKIDGPMMSDELLARPWRLMSLASQMAETHLRLHQLSPCHFPCPRATYLDRQLRTTEALLRNYHLDGLVPGLDWLRENRPPPPARRAILHLDYHPLNLMCRGDGSLAVLDWTYSDVGDPHADVAMTLMLMRCMPLEARTWWTGLMVGVGRALLWRLYLHAYRRRAPLDEDVLRYYQALAALGRLARHARWQWAGARATGSKPSIVARLGSADLAGLCGYFRRLTGVAISGE